MKYLIISDTHTNRAWIDLIDKFDIDLVFHAGDSQLLAVELPNTGLYVKGNCDFDPALADEQVYCDQQHSFYITHGHLQNVNYDEDGIVKRAKEVGADIAIFGHTHSLLVKNIDDILLINPGSYQNSRSQWPNTFMILEDNNLSIYQASDNQLLETIRIDDESFGQR